MTLSIENVLYNNYLDNNILLIQFRIYDIIHLHSSPKIQNIKHNPTIFYFYQILFRKNIFKTP